MVRTSGDPGTLVEVQSPYERNIAMLKRGANAPKLANIRRLMRTEWKDEKKAVFCTMGSVNALILYWVRYIPLLCVSQFPLRRSQMVIDTDCFCST